MRISLVAIAAFSALSVTAPADPTSVGALEFYWLCTTQATGCKGIEAIGDMASHSIERSAFLATTSSATWSECQRSGDPFLCVTLEAGDMERLNAFAIPAHRHDSAALVYRGKVIAIMGFIGPTHGPLYIGGPNGAMSTGDVKSFLSSGQ